MSNAAVWIGPLIVTVIIGICIVLMAIFALLAFMRSQRALSLQRLAEADRDRLPPILFHQQSAAIDAVINELASRPATYSTFPADIRDMLYSAHDKARELERGVTF